MSEQASHSAYRVLLVEDNEPNAIYATEALKYFGCEVTRACAGEEAVRLADGDRFDVIFMDYHMTRMNGLEATRLIRGGELANDRTPVPIIALTASSTDEEREACLESGMVDVLLKPFLLTELQRLLTKWVWVR